VVEYPGKDIYQGRQIGVTQIVGRRPDIRGGAGLPREGNEIRTKPQVIKLITQDNLDCATTEINHDIAGESPECGGRAQLRGFNRVGGRDSAKSGVHVVNEDQ